MWLKLENETKTYVGHKQLFVQWKLNGEHDIQHVETRDTLFPAAGRGCDVVSNSEATFVVHKFTRVFLHPVFLTFSLDVTKLF